MAFKPLLCYRKHQPNPKHFSNFAPYGCPIQSALSNEPGPTPWSQRKSRTKDPWHKNPAEVASEQDLAGPFMRLLDLHPALRQHMIMTMLSIPDMSCGHCKATVEAALASVPDAGPVQVDLSGRTVEIAGSAPLQAVLAALDRAGYPATVAG
jgi:copper chaperone